MDSFERYKLASEANRRARAHNGKHGTPKNGRGVIPKVDRFSMIHKKPLHKKNESLRTPLAAMDSNTNTGKNTEKRLKTVGGHVRRQHNAVNFIGVRNRFKQFMEEFKVSLSDSASTWAASVAPLMFINWFNNNKFDYVLHDKEGVQRSVVAGTWSGTKQKPEDQKPEDQEPDNRTRPSKTTDIMKVLKRSPYIRPEFTNKAALNPTHLVCEAQKIGKFMYSARLKKLKDGTVEQSLLIAADTRFDLEENSAVVLKEQNSYTQHFGDEKVKVYVRWHVYKEEPVEINLWR